MTPLGAGGLGRIPIGEKTASGRGQRAQITATTDHYTVNEDKLLMQFVPLKLSQTYIL